MWSGVRDLARRPPGNLAVKVPNPAHAMGNMRSARQNGVQDLSRCGGERFFYYGNDKQINWKPCPWMTILWPFKTLKRRASHDG
jgi:hypothetical protein